MLQIALPVLKQSTRIRGCKSGDSYEDGEPDPHNPGKCRYVSNSEGPSEGPKLMTVARIASEIPAIPVTVHTFQTPRGCEGPK